MRKFGFPLLVLFLLSGLTQCHNAAKKKLVGIWQLENMAINSTVLSGNSLGTWLWEFNDAGGFLTDVAGMREKGRYTLSDSTLTLKVTIPHIRPGQVYRVAKLDSAEMDLVSAEVQNKSTLHFVKRKLGDVTKEDKD